MYRSFLFTLYHPRFRGENAIRRQNGIRRRIEASEASCHSSARPGTAMLRFCSIECGAGCRILTLHKLCMSATEAKDRKTGKRAGRFIYRNASGMQGSGQSVNVPFLMRPQIYTRLTERHAVVTACRHNVTHCNNASLPLPICCE
jgi:hypothetical protein